MVDCIDSFVVLGRVLELGQPPPLRHVPSAAVESLPWALGGLRGAIIPAHSMALNAKVAAALLHPKRHPWKVLMRRAFQNSSRGDLAAGGGGVCCGGLCGDVCLWCGGVSGGGAPGWGSPAV